jgi:UDP-N-acetylmuramyl pentapeptide phosphotransferase/UDP-N-acetylglucosamine-1-phosphate transferase
MAMMPRVALLLPLAAAVAGLVAFGLVRRWRRGGLVGSWVPSVANVRGRILPLVLGWAVLAGLTVSVAGVAAVIAATGGHPSALTTRRTLAMLGGLAAVFAGGLYDDTRAGPARGWRGHLGALRRGEITPGIVKLVVAVAAASLVAFVPHGHDWRIAAGVPLMAGCSNLWNLLDVVPGRATKAFLPVAAVLLALRPRSGATLLVAAVAGAAAAVFPFDLRERAMLGDAGASVLGFAVGLGLYADLPTYGLWIALAVVVALHVLGETVTLSKLIRSARPLRWFDGLGRIRANSEPKVAIAPGGSDSMKSRSD